MKYMCMQNVRVQAIIVIIRVSIFGTARYKSQSSLATYTHIYSICINGHHCITSGLDRRLHRLKSETCQLGYQLCGLKHTTLFLFLFF